MDSLNDFFKTSFKTNILDWEKSLLSELKISEVGNKGKKLTLNGLTLPTLSLERDEEVQLSSKEDWKKASTSYASMPEENIEALLLDDLKNGVRNFFFFDGALSDKKWGLIEKTLKTHPTPSEIEVFLLGMKNYKSDSFKVVKNLISGKEFHELGGSSIHELALISKKIIETDEDEIFIGVYVDSLFFHNIAKLRACRLMLLKILEDSGRKSKLKIVALTSFENWTLYDRYTNILRNETAVASAYMGGADHVQSCGHNILLELESGEDLFDEHFERSQRMGRNTTHILALESLLGVVQDPSYGSYHLENLTQTLCEKSWTLMQRLLLNEDISQEISEVREKKLLMIKTRKLIVSGVNDFPDPKETLNISLKSSPFFRYPRIFEELRLRMEKFRKPKVFISVFGDYGALNLRLSFVKNYFELLGLEVQDTNRSEKDLDSFRKNLSERMEEITVLCALDEDYLKLMPHSLTVNSPHKFIAGKFEVSGYKNLYAGQNVYEVLSELVEALERGRV